MTTLEKRLFNALRDIVYDDKSDIKRGLIDNAKKAMADYRKELEREQNVVHQC